jgi:tetratricopeptide (TPR) repeat protein
MAFALDLPEADAPRSFTSVKDLLIRDGRVWIPVEVTERRNGFLAAWQTGAGAWREAVATGSEGFCPVHEAWKEYAPVGLPGASSDISMPPVDAITAAFLKESTRFIDREIFPMVTKLEAEVRKSGGSPASRNKLGILYAKYGKMDQAEAEFKAALSKGDYVPAMLNLGNLYFLAKDYKRAHEPYERAVRMDPRNPRARIALSMVQYELGSYDQSKAGWAEARGIDPALAERYAYLGGSGAGSSRAGAADERKGAVLWTE